MSIRRNRLRSHLRDWFNRLTGLQKLLATIATLIITIGAVATAINASLDLVNRLGVDSLGAVYLGVEAQDIVAQGIVYEEQPASHTPVPNYGVRVPARDRSSTIIPAYGIRVTVVDRNSPAARAGVKRGDIITTINGTMLQDVDDFEEVMRNTEHVVVTYGSPSLEVGQWDHGSVPK